MIDASDSETQRRLEKGEIIADCVGFILAGYETTIATVLPLQLTCWLLPLRHRRDWLMRFMSTLKKILSVKVMHFYALLCTLHGA